MSAVNYYGYTPDRWHQMKEAGLAYLEELAALGDRAGHTDYTTFCREIHARTALQIDPHDHALPHLLGDIGTDTYKRHGVVLTVLIHYKDGDREPGPGWYALCQKLGLLGKKPTLDAKLMLWTSHVKRAYEVYGR